MPPSIKTENVSETKADPKIRPPHVAAKKSDISVKLESSESVQSAPKIAQNPPALPGASLAKSALHRPGISPGTSASGHTGNIAPKYAKIQPAIAIKPKPIAPSIAAGGKAKKGAVKSSFDPRYNPLSSPSSAMFSEDQSSAANINTSRKWVLPPRPRPGRKPTAPGSSGQAVSDDERKQALHKKCKVSKRSAAPALSSSPPSTPPSVGAKRLSVQKNAVSSPAVTDTGIGREVPPVPQPQPPSKRVVELQRVYLARLKEQELVQNYIDILSNQIKELKFVQSGVITFDALHSGASVKPKVPASSAPADQLDHINNVRDLDAFLAHLTTQSNVIHSVTKKFVGDSSKEPLNEGSHLQSQIKHYLDMKTLHGNARVPLDSKRQYALDTKRGISLDVKPSSHDCGDPADFELLESQPATSGDSKAGSFFTSGFFRPLDMNLFEQEDGIMNVDIINERDPFSGSMEAIQNKRHGLAAEGEAGSSNVSPDSKQINVKGVKKIGCGFCSNGSPCLCFDADSVFGEK